MRPMILSLVFLIACAQGDPQDGLTTASTTGTWVSPLGGAAWKIGFNLVNSSAPGNSTCFGKPLAQLVHAGEDWGTSAGAPVRAIGAGTVVFSQFFNYPGSVIVIRHDLSSTERSALGIAETSIYSQYGHLTNVLVSAGAVVSAGQQIASVLDQASNSHLHWEVRKVQTPQLCAFSVPGPGYTNTGTDARSFGYMSPSGSVSLLAGAAAPTTCDNNVPLGGTACNPSDPGAEFVCTNPGASSSLQWTRQACPIGETCQGTECKPSSSIPPCGSGLSCALNQISGSSKCLSGSTAVFCCPSGQQIVNGICTPPCGSGLFCALNQIPGASQCLSGSTPVFCCPSGQRIVNGVCSF